MICVGVRGLKSWAPAGLLCRVGQIRGLSDGNPSAGLRGGAPSTVWGKAP